jgi:hypothetical protein
MWAAASGLDTARTDLWCGCTGRRYAAAALLPPSAAAWIVDPPPV